MARRLPRPRQGTMFALPGILLLVLLTFVRPQEFVPALEGVPFLELAAALAVLGVVLDVGMGKSRLAPAPQLPWVLLFGALCLPSVVLRAPNALGSTALVVAVSIGLFVLVAEGAPRLSALSWLAGLLLGVALLLAAVGVHQHFAPLGCFELDSERADDVAVAVGRPCERIVDCEQGASRPDAEYICEHVGLFGTSSIGSGRVRYRGHLNDPNELALVICIGLPFAFLASERRRSPLRLALLVGAVILVGACTVFTRSRGGQLVFLTVVGAYLVRRFGKTGAAVGAVLSLPILLLGGRGGSEAASSVESRLEAWAEGLNMLRHYPVLGVGQGQFTDHYVQTAHNSFLLTASEIGLPGMLVWSMILYISLKIPIHALRTRHDDSLTRVWAMALFASTSGLVVGVFFLSFAYHPVLWVYLGLTGAFDLALRRQFPDWRVPIDWRDVAGVAAFDVVLVLLLHVYVRLHPFGA